MRRFSLPLTVLALAFGLTGTAVAAPPAPGTSTEPTVPTQTGIAVSVDRVLVKLNALEDRLVALTAKHDALTVKHDALVAKTQSIWSLTKNNGEYAITSFYGLRHRIDETCDVVAETRHYAADASVGHAIYDFNHACP